MRTQPATARAMLTCFGPFCPDWRFPYPSPYLEIEVACLVFYMLAEFCRILIGSYSNKRESWGFMIAFLVMGVAAIMINAFFLSWQTFVLRVDVIVNAIAMTLTALQVLLGLLCTCSFVIVFDDAAAAENLMLGEDAGHPHVD